MQEQELRALVEEMVRKMTNTNLHDNLTIDKSVKHTTDATTEPTTIESGTLADIAQKDLRKWYLVDNPKDKDAFMEYKVKTPARIGIGRAGARYKTETMLRVRADHAAAQDSVFSDVSEDFVKAQGYIAVQTLCDSKDEYITRPDKGRRFSGNQLEIIRKAVPNGTKVAIVIGDGLSSAAIEANAKEVVPAVKQVLSAKGITVGDILFIKYCRVGAMDAIGEVTDCDVICLFVGERPGLVTAESMSAYIAYKPKHGLPEAKRTVVSNIHKGGTPPVEAGAHVGELILKMLEKKASGIDLK
ncbi:MAG: ethanolamine ammonia-lyase subunit EutC [Clostridia bacterium]|nr:ethanolamine ammonia-lyase subunit EutC [Clostridia bacterium]